MDQDQIVRQLLREAIETGRTAEEVCEEHPEHLGEVKRLWKQARAVEEELEALFPSSAAELPAAESDLSLPQIPGYDVRRILGYGGMGVVYQARHLALNRIVAIKIPLAGAFATASERQRHIREARAVAALGHPNIVTVHDVGEVGGRPYFTMEFIDGQSLSQKLASTPLPAREAATLLATLADAVQCAHLAGIIHRDLKPANVLISSDGTPKITDFGLARQEQSEASLTVTGAQFGTPSYMAPEQASGTKAMQGPSGDIYSLGAILYDMLTGRPPFRAESPVETIRQVLEEDPPSPTRLNPRTPRDLATICLSCLHKDPRRRYASAAALADDLRRFLAGEPIHARPIGALERAYRWARRQPSYAALAGACIVVVVAGLGAGFWVQHVQNVRAGETTLREGRARQAIETAVGVVADLRASGRWVEARHVLDDAHSRVPDANSELVTQGLARADTLLSTAQDLDEIRRRYPETSDSGFSYSPAHESYNRAFSKMGLGPEVSLEAAVKSIEASPIRAEILTALDNAAFVARVLKRRDDITRYLTLARKADPNPWRDRFRQTDTWYDRDALLALERDSRVAAEPPPPHQIVIVGVLLSGLGANDKAVEILRNAYERDPIDFWINLELGNALARAGRPAEACLYFRGAVTIQPSNVGPWISLAQQLNLIGLRDEAIIAIRHATVLNPHILVAWRNSIGYLRVAGRIDDAEAVRVEAIRANPEQRAVFDDLGVHIRWDRARLAASQGNWKLALTLYKASEGENDDAEFLFEATAVGILAGDADLFERTRRAMLEWNRSRPIRQFLVSRATTLIQSPTQVVERGAGLSEAELLANPNAFWSLSQRGAILCRTGRYEEAIRFFERTLATTSTPGRTGPVWLWLTVAHHHLGHKAEAAKWHAMATAWFATLERGMPADAASQGFHLHNWLEAQILRREVDALLSNEAGTPELRPTPGETAAGSK